MLDLLYRSAWVIDGLRTAMYRADVGVENGKDPLAIRDYVEGDPLRPARLGIGQAYIVSRSTEGLSRKVMPTRRFEQDRYSGNRTQDTKGDSHAYTDRSQQP